MPFNGGQERDAAMPVIGCGYANPQTSDTTR